MPRSSAIDPARYVSLGLTHVQYDAHDPVAKILGLVTLSPIFLLCAYVTIIIYRRELTFINALVGQLGCEGVNWFLKRLVKQPRPYPGALGKGYGMPSSHSQFMGFFAAFFICHFWLHHPAKAKPATLINTIRRAEHVAVIFAIIGLSALTCYSRYHLAYHTPAQILVGLSLGLTIGIAYYYVTEYMSRQPLRLPAPLGSPYVQSPAGSPLAKRSASSVSTASGTVQRRANASTTQVPAEAPTSAPRQRRRSSLSKMLPPMPDLHPAPPLRQMILDNPIAVALRVRDSWTVWRDGGIEGEYGTWRREWERRREWNWSERAALPSSQQPQLANSLDSGVIAVKTPVKKSRGDSSERVHYNMMRQALRYANRCEPTQTAFCVGCVITARSSDGSSVVAWGYSRELPGNTHAEQCALDKLRREGDASDGAEASSSEPDLELDLYTTMEACSERLSGAEPCAQRIVAFNRARPRLHLPAFGSAPRRVRIARVFQGVSEPQDFVADCQGARTLRDAGIEVQTVRALEPRRTEDGKEDWDWLERECLRIAKYGHPDQPQALPGAEALWK